MPLTTLEIRNVRIYAHAKINPDPHLNLIVGANASGKTSLLEAIHLLATGRSYRSVDIEQIQKQNTVGLSVQGTLSGDGVPRDKSTLLSFSRGPDGRKITINSLPQTQVSALAQLLPLQVISPDSHYEFRGSSRLRRAALDWSLFHVEPDFASTWTRYQRILQQRNAALKTSLTLQTRGAWDQGLAVLGEDIHQRRLKVLARLKVDFLACCRELLGPDQEVDLVLESGWRPDRTLLQCLREDVGRDNARGFTHSGPHRADLTVGLRQLSKSLDASHGQYKLLVMALRVAQIRFFSQAKKESCCLLIDDLSAELDPNHRARLVDLLSRLAVQLFVTSTEPLLDTKSWASHKSFHVEQGSLREAI